MPEQRLTLGHSPDPDDAFMFFALAQDRIPTDGYRFEHVHEDIQTLNERASRGELDITAISVHAFAYVRDHYALLPSGASMGDGYGPRLVAEKHYDREEISARTVAVPGQLTSAFLALQLWLGKPAAELKLKFVPFNRIFQTLKNGEAEVGLLIHEGQLTYSDEGLVLCQDLGEWWQQTHAGLPLPLGANAVHKRHPAVERKKIAGILDHSIRYGMEHRAEAIGYAMQFARGLSVDLAGRFVDMYVNRWTLDYGNRGRQAVETFLREAARSHLIPGPEDFELFD